ncbi:hypothetical protein [Paenibacillus sp.]|jgi:hypothetical protein|uniref:hypothetical protein n=1 Tax=Paenibacillus sp. TaxID=58172 RepID=UPI002837F40C|nr:hypothetical protein [Paenibacillus sp.]MDR0267979.1 hypothetical protein [Paenibacillus sp.]
MNWWKRYFEIRNDKEMRMKLIVKVKKPGKRKELAIQELELPKKPLTLRELIRGVVANGVQEFKEKQSGKSVISYLTETQIGESAELGKVGFGAVYDDRQPDENQAVKAALTAFEDGLYRVFINETEIVGLDAPLVIDEGDRIVFMRFTMLAGGMW